MPSFDIVSEVDMHEAGNAVDQANREVNTRFDFKGTNAKFEHSNEKITLIAPAKFHLQQMMLILESKLTKRSIDIGCVERGEPTESLHEARQEVTIRQGIDQDLARKVVKLIKNTKFKVQAAIQGDQVRVSGKKRDDLQQVIAMLREEKFDLPMQYINFRD